MSTKWKEIDAEQLREARPSTCRYCGGPIYWEQLPGGAKRPVDATDFGRHNCARRGTEKNRPKKETEMPTDKGYCKHGEFILTEGYPQCMEEAKLTREAEADKAEEMVTKDSESLAMNQEGQDGLEAIETDGKATIGRLSLWNEPDGATIGEVTTERQSQLLTEVPTTWPTVTEHTDDLPELPAGLILCNLFDYISQNTGDIIKRRDNARKRL